MAFVLNESSAYSSLVEMIWYTRSERACTFTSGAVSNWEVVITTFKGKTISPREVQGQKHRKRISPPTLSFWHRLQTWHVHAPSPCKSPS